ncbi:MAG: CDP-glycerol glycerophosphotransferase family protein, partial [Clostridia bacterium]|nr:CDP-glycerol glycerophosphotransferase family protein [Clostridia bacterium]
NFVVGKGIRGTCSQFVKSIKNLPTKIANKFKSLKGLWARIWKQIDRILGLPARAIVKRRTPIVKNKVFFFTQEFRYGCNPKYICEELVRQGVDVDIVWRVNDKAKGGFPSYVRTVKAGTYDYYKEIFSSNIVVANSYIFLDQTLFLNKKQTLIQTWHGSLGIKKFGKNDMKGSWRRRWASVQTGKMSTYCITNSSFVSSSLRNTYWPKTPMLEYGHPRNDLFFDTNKMKRATLKHNFCMKKKISESYNFVMYAPTFRDSHDFTCYDIDFDRLVAALTSRFGGKWCVLLRYHPSLLKIYKKKMLATKGYRVKILNVTDYIDMQELIAITDIAITDYSSWIYDFMLRRKPGFIFATDINLYNTERGFCYPLETTPFPIARNNAELEGKIMTFDYDHYLSRLEDFLREKGCVEDGHASERVVELIKKITGAESKFDEEDSDRQKFQEKMFLQAENEKGEKGVLYLRGDEKTCGQNIISEKTLFNQNGDIYTKKIFLREGDKIDIVFGKTINNEIVEKKYIGYSQLNEASKELFMFEKENNKLHVLSSGSYEFQFDIQIQQLFVTFIPRKSVAGYDYYLDGNFSKEINWNGVLKKKYKLVQEDNKAIIKKIYMKKGGCFVVVGLPQGNKDWGKSFIFNFDYLLYPNYYFEKSTGDNKTIKVKESGFYDITIDSYSNTINANKL